MFNKLNSFWINQINSNIEHIVEDNETMGSNAEFQKMLRQRDEIIADLRRTVDQQRNRIDELTSQLDKYQSVMSTGTGVSGAIPTGNGAVPATRRRRAEGISGESGMVPQRSAKSQHEVLSKEMFKVYPKTAR